MKSQQSIANSKRKVHGGPAKKLAMCSHCGLMLGVRERRQHGDRRKGGSLEPVNRPFSGQNNQ
jgi:hypothetical protein